MCYLFEVYVKDSISPVDIKRVNMFGVNSNSSQWC